MSAGYSKETARKIDRYEGAFVGFSDPAIFLLSSFSSGFSGDLQLPQ
jgi:hypothetical protein